MVLNGWCFSVFLFGDFSIHCCFFQFPAALLVFLLLFRIFCYSFGFESSAFTSLFFCHFVLFLCYLLLYSLLLSSRIYFELID